MWIICFLIIHISIAFLFSFFFFLADVWRFSRHERLRTLACVISIKTSQLALLSVMYLPCDVDSSSSSSSSSCGYVDNLLFNYPYIHSFSFFFFFFPALTLPRGAGGRGRRCINQSDFSGGESEAPTEKEVPPYVPLISPIFQPVPPPEAGGGAGVKGVWGKGGRGGLAVASASFFALKLMS